VPVEVSRVLIELPVVVEHDRDGGNVMFRARCPLGFTYRGSADRGVTSWSLRLWVNPNPIPFALKTMHQDGKHEPDDAVTRRLVATWTGMLVSAVKAQAGHEATKIANSLRPHPRHPRPVGP
jgi:hypothetical protein